MPPRLVGRRSSAGFRLAAPSGRTGHIAAIEVEAASPRPSQACPRLLSELLNALLEGQSGRTVHDGKRSNYLDKRLQSLSVL